MVTDRAEGRCKPDIEALVAEKSSLRRSGMTHVAEIGSWHTEPSSHETPSEADLSHWLNSLDVLRSAHYVGLVLTAEPTDERWLRPKVHGWVVRRADHSGRTPICEPAIVKAGRA